MVPVPGRNVHSGLDAVFPAGIGKQTHHIRRPGAVLYRVFRKLTGPQAEAVVMLNRKNGSRKAPIPENPCPLAAVQFPGGKLPRILPAVSPFLICKGVHGKMEESRLSPPEPGKLPFIGHGTVGPNRNHRGSAPS